VYAPLCWWAVRAVLEGSATEGQRPLCSLTAPSRDACHSFCQRRLYTSKVSEHLPCVSPSTLFLLVYRGGMTRFLRTGRLAAGGFCWLLWSPRVLSYGMKLHEIPGEQDYLTNPCCCIFFANFWSLKHCMEISGF